MNPPGQWIFKNMEWQFVNYDILAIYGKVFPVMNTNGKTMWKWECRTGLETRAKFNLPIEGFAYSEENAKYLVECILERTETCEFKKEDIYK